MGPTHGREAERRHALDQAGRSSGLEAAIHCIQQALAVDAAATKIGDLDRDEWLERLLDTIATWVETTSTVSCAASPAHFAQ